MYFFFGRWFRQKVMCRRINYLCHLTALVQLNLTRGKNTVSCLSNQEKEATTNSCPEEHCWWLFFWFEPSSLSLRLALGDLNIGNEISFLNWKKNSLTRWRPDQVDDAHMQNFVISMCTFATKYPRGGDFEQTRQIASAFFVWSVKFTGAFFSLFCEYIFVKLLFVATFTQMFCIYVCLKCAVSEKVIKVKEVENLSEFKNESGIPLLQRTGVVGGGRFTGSVIFLSVATLLKIICANNMPCKDKTRFHLCVYSRLQKKKQMNWGVCC